jgi:hypothetical protein
MHSGRRADVFCGCRAGEVAVGFDLIMSSLFEVASSHPGFGTTAVGTLRGVFSLTPTSIYYARFQNGIVSSRFLPRIWGIQGDGELPVHVRRFLAPCSFRIAPPRMTEDQRYGKVCMSESASQLKNLESPSRSGKSEAEVIP